MYTPIFHIIKEIYIEILKDSLKDDKNIFNMTNQKQEIN